MLEQLRTFFRQESMPRSILLVLVAVALLSGLNKVILPWAGASTVALIYFIAILLLSFVLSRSATLFMACVAAVSWNYLFLAPIHTLHIEQPEDAVTFVVFLTFAIVAGHLTGKLRSQAEATRKREARMAALYEFATRMNGIAGHKQIIEAGLGDLERISGTQAAVYLLEDGRLQQATPEEQRDFLADAHAALAAVSDGSTILDSSKMTLLVPLRTRTAAAGIVAARSTEAMSAEQQALVQAMTLQIGTLLDREMLWKLTQEARTNEEIDRLYTALLDLLTHEIRTPIAVIQGTVSSLLGGLIRRPEDSKKLLGEADQALTRLNRLIDNLLDMSRIEAGKLKLNLDWHDPAEILQKVVTQAEREFPESRLRVSGNAAYLLRVDFNLMEKVFYNVIRNACIHSPPGVTISVSILAEKSELLTVIQDDGPGIPPEIRRSLFDRFSRGSDSGAGIGIGLSVVKGILEAHGAGVSCESVEPHGTRFVIRFPLTQRNTKPFEISA
jgi:two-component system sensor histidine kinase KdpD